MADDVLSELEDLIIYPLSEEKGKEGTPMMELKVRLARFPKDVSLREFGRFSGPWEDYRGGFFGEYRWVEVAGTRNRVPKKILKPVMRTVDGEGKEILEDISPHNYPIGPRETRGTLVRMGGEFPRFSRDNQKYIESVSMFHYRHGTMRDLDDETGDAIYIEELPNLARLVGRKVMWEFVPYIRTMSGASSGVDDLRWAIVGKGADDKTGKEGAGKSRD